MIPWAGVFETVLINRKKALEACRGPASSVHLGMTGRHVHGRTGASSENYYPSARAGRRVASCKGCVGRSFGRTNPVKLSML